MDHPKHTQAQKLKLLININKQNEN